MGSVNKMFATNVAIVFGPTVMRAETDSLEMATLMPVQNGIVEIMVNEFDTVFRKWSLLLFWRCLLCTSYLYNPVQFFFDVTLFS